MTGKKIKIFVISINPIKPGYQIKPGYPKKPGPVGFFKKTGFEQTLMILTTNLDRHTD